MKTIINSTNKYLVKDTTKDFHSEYGVIKSSDLSKKKAKTNKDIQFSIFDPIFIDVYEKIKRRAQIITLKDIGTIISLTGINQDSVVLDAGSGSGALCCFLAHLCKKVISYELREDHQKIAQDNVDFLGLKNIALGAGDVREKIAEKDIDLIVFDIPDPWNAIDQAKKALKQGGFLVLYSPTIPQVIDTVNIIKEKHRDDLIFLSTLETIQREWEVDGRKVRPKSSYINHTGFLTFIRRV